MSILLEMNVKWKCDGISQRREWKLWNIVFYVGINISVMVGQRNRNTHLHLDGNAPYIFGLFVSGILEGKKEER